MEIDVQRFAISAISGYFNTFASLSPDSRLPLIRSRRVAKLIEELDIPKGNFCPLCLLFSLDESFLSSLYEDCDHCNLLLSWVHHKKEKESTRRNDETGEEETQTRAFNSTNSS